MGFYVMTQSYVQYLNVGLGLINNTEPISDWNIDDAIESALMLDDNSMDVRIIGFRFYDIETTTNNVIRRSGIYYLQGEIYTFPKIDQEITDFIKNAHIDFPRGQQIIKIKKQRLFLSSDSIFVNNYAIVGVVATL